VDVAAQTLTLDAYRTAATCSHRELSDLQRIPTTVPDDFHSFLTVWDPAYNWQLWTQVSQTELNQLGRTARVVQGTGYVVSFRDYNPLVAACSASHPIPAAL
jgi:hypothetical protein